MTPPPVCARCGRDDCLGEVTVHVRNGTLIRYSPKKGNLTVRNVVFVAPKSEEAGK